MVQALSLETATAILGRMVRGIDKKVEYRVAVAEGQEAAVTVHLSLRRQATTLTIPAGDIEDASRDLMQRHQLRTTIKRALDRMTFKPIPVLSTKTNNSKTEGGGFFRPSHGGGRGRR
jgi:hypothetical protein